MIRIECSGINTDPAELIMGASKGRCISEMTWQAPALRAIALLAINELSSSVRGVYIIWNGLLSHAPYCKAGTARGVSVALGRCTGVSMAILSFVRLLIVSQRSKTLVSH